ncbi:MAG: hypothetical protein KDD61_16920 [Bdellovibrionales bacterium]|nr:hypothetical protein [Bdellovibrionales bacterium]
MKRNFVFVSVLLIATVILWSLNDRISIQDKTVQYRNGDPVDYLPYAGEEKSVNATESSQDLPDTVFTQIVKEVASEDEIQVLKKAERVLSIQRKVLRTFQERRELEAALSDIDFLKKVGEIVVDTSNLANLGLNEHEAIRMRAVLILCRAFEWSENPKLDVVKDLVMDIVIRDDLDAMQDLALKKSMGADRLELFTNLKSVDRRRGQEMERRNQSAVMAKLMRFANNFYRLN